MHVAGSCDEQEGQRLARAREMASVHGPPNQHPPITTAHSPPLTATICHRRTSIKHVNALDPEIMSHCPHPVRLAAPLSADVPALHAHPGPLSPEGSRAGATTSLSGALSTLIGAVMGLPGDIGPVRNGLSSAGDWPSAQPRSAAPRHTAQNSDLEPVIFVINEIMIMCSGFTAVHEVYSYRFMVASRVFDRSAAERVE